MELYELSSGPFYSQIQAEGGRNEIEQGMSSSDKVIIFVFLTFSPSLHTAQFQPPTLSTMSLKKGERSTHTTQPEWPYEKCSGRDAARIDTGRERPRDASICSCRSTLSVCACR